MILNSPTISGSLTVTGNIITSGSITISGSIASASYASNAELLDGLDSTVFTLTSSFNAQTASFTAFTASLNAFSASINTATSSFSGRVGALESYTASLNLKTASFATTGSNNFIGTQTITGSVLQSGSFTSTGTLTAQTLVVQTITSSVVYSSGSNIFGNALNNTQTFTGSINITGSLSLNSITIPTSASLASTYLQLAGGTLTGDLSIAYTTSNLRLFLNNTTATTGRSWYFNSYSNGNLYIGNTTAGDIFNFSSAGAATFSSTISGTTIYGSTAVCSAVGLFSGCVGIGFTGYGGSKLTLVASTNPTCASSANMQLSIGESSQNTTYSFKLGYIYVGGGYVGAIQTIAGGSASTTVINPDGGNVGIGTTSPAKVLDVYSSATSNTAQIVASDAGSTNRLYLGTFSNTSYISFGGTYQSGWSANGSNAIANIGMSAGSGASSIQFETSTSNGVGPTERMRITSGGLVGIGDTSNATARLSIISCSDSYALTVKATPINQGSYFWNSNTDAIAIISFQRSNTGTFFGQARSCQATIFAAGCGPFTIGTQTTQPLILGVNDAEAMRIVSDGKIGMGRIPSTYTLEVNGGIYATSGFYGNASTSTQPKTLYSTNANFTSNTYGGTENVDLTGYYLPYFTPIMFRFNIQWTGNGAIQGNYIGFADAHYFNNGTATIIWTDDGINGGAGYPSISVSVQGSSYNTRYLRFTMVAEASTRPSSWNWTVTYSYFLP